MVMRVLSLVLLLATLVSCHSQQEIIILNYAQADKLVPAYLHHPSQRKVGWVGPPPAVLTYLRRTNPAKEAIIVGQVSLLGQDGRLLVQPAATISVDKKFTSSDAHGNYAQVVAPGRHTLRGGGIGLLWSVAKPLKVALGDSVEVDFELLSDPRPLID
jgi:hypothetical protein